MKANDAHEGQYFDGEEVESGQGFPMCLKEGLPWRSRPALRRRIDPMLTKDTLHRVPIHRDPKIVKGIPDLGIGSCDIQNRLPKSLLPKERVNLPSVRPGPGRTGDGLLSLPFIWTNWTNAETTQANVLTDRKYEIRPSFGTVPPLFPAFGISATIVFPTGLIGPSGTRLGASVLQADFICCRRHDVDGRCE